MRVRFFGPHWDHVIGLPFFGPLYAKDRRIILHPMLLDTGEGIDEYRYGKNDMA